MNIDQKPQTAADVTETHIAAWKEKYKEVSTIEVSADPIDPENIYDSVDFDDAEIVGPKLIGYVRKPNKQILAMAYKFMGSDGYLSAAKEMLKAIWLGGDNEILLNDAKLHFAASQVSHWIPVYQAKLKKL